MISLNRLALLLSLLVTLVKSDVSLEQWEPKDLLRTKLETQLSKLRTSENEVTDVKPEPKLKAAEKPDYPIAFREEPTCPNFNDVMNDVKNSMKLVNQLVLTAISTFTDIINNKDYKCKFTLNLLSNFKCFVRVFAASYKQMTVFWTEASELQQSVSKMVSEYGQYSSKCNKNWTLGNTLQLIDLYKVVEGYIRDA